jgi:hypothetical protein
MQRLVFLYSFQEVVVASDLRNEAIDDQVGFQFGYPQLHRATKIKIFRN